MELFEILFILFFILIPVIEGIRKSRQRGSQGDIELPDRPSPRPGQRPGGPDRPARADPRTSYPAPPPRPTPEPEPVEASDMIPDDLWEILTGERRPRPGRPEPDEDQALDQALEPEEAYEPDLEPVMEERFEPAPWDEPQPLEPLPPPPRTLDLPTPSVQRELEPTPPRRRRAPLREVIEYVPEPRRETSLMRSLRSPEGLRDAVLLREILGPPPGLDG